MIMKFCKTLLTGVVLMFAINGFANASLEQDLKNICTIVKANDKSELRKKMKLVQADYRLKLKDYYSGISCGGNSLIRTAMLNDAVEAGTLLIKKMPKKDLAQPEKDGKTLMAWVSENGLDTSPLSTVLTDRI